MNKLIHTLQMALLAMLMGMTAACTPDSYDLVPLLTIRKIRISFI